MFLRILLLASLMLAVSYGYFKYHKFLAHWVLEMGVLTAVLVLSLVLGLVTFFVGFILKSNIKKSTSSEKPALAKGINPKMLAAGLMTGVLIMVPMIAVYIWLYLKFG